MKYLTLLFTVALISCNSADETTVETTDSTDTVTTGVTDTGATKDTDPGPTPRDTATAKKTYQNLRFKDVTVERLGDSTFRISGKGQIFEANFGWIIEDGHDELKNGYQMTDAGAPEWGNFSFTVTAAKRRPNSTLHLVLYESSAMDGSRVHQLPIPLY